MWFPRSRKLIFQRTVAAIARYWNWRQRTSTQARSRRQRSWDSCVSNVRAIELLEPRTLLTATSDFGDAPLPYAVTISENGPSHLDAGPTLGATRDLEDDGTHSANADADGADEDGVAFSEIRVGALDTVLLVKVAGGA